MNEFRIFAHGEEFYPDAYLATTTLNFDGAWQKRPDGPESNGIYATLGDARELAIQEQDQIAINYLRANLETLKELSKYPGVSAFILGLQYYLDPADGIMGFCMGPSSELMELVLEVGLELNFYVSVVSEWE